MYTCSFFIQYRSDIVQVDRQKMASLDPMKAKQAERLGMGLSRARYDF